MGNYCSFMDAVKALEEKNERDRSKPPVDPKRVIFYAFGRMGTFDELWKFARGEPNNTQPMPKLS